MRSIVITGASSGIGAACARLFLAEGWRVGLLARREEMLREVAGGSENALCLAADVTDERAVEAAFDRFTDWAGRIDVLFNNAGAFGKAAFIDEMDRKYPWQAKQPFSFDQTGTSAAESADRTRPRSPVARRASRCCPPKSPWRCGGSTTFSCARLGGHRIRPEMYRTSCCPPCARATRSSACSSGGASGASGACWPRGARAARS